MYNYLEELESTILGLNDHIDPWDRNSFAFKLRNKLLFERRRVLRYGGSPSLAFITAKGML